MTRLRRSPPALLRLAVLALGLAPAAGAWAQAGAFPYGGPPVFDPPAPSLPTLVPTLRSPVSPGAADETPPAPDGDAAFGAFQRGYFATALDAAMQRLKAHPQDGPAMALIGEIYAQGMAVKRDPAEAAKWDRLASQEGNREGTFSYGLALLTGDGVPQDRTAAAAMFEKAAAQGHAGALYNLGVMAIQGDGKVHDFARAAGLFQRAADAGDIDALFALGTLVRSGMGVAQDPVKAAELMKQAADDKHVGAEVEYGIMLFNGKGVDKDEGEAARYFRLAAYQGNPIAENRLARLYAAGRGVPRDPVEAARWHILARAAGIPDPWLDGQLAAMSAADKGKVEDVVRRQLAR